MVDAISPIGPYIPPSSIFETNYTNNLETGKIYLTKLSVGSSTTTTILTSGHLYGLDDPVNPTDAINKKYADANIPGGIPGGDSGDIQYNDGTTFAGSNQFTFSTNNVYMHSLFIKSTLDTSAYYSTATIQDLDYVSKIPGSSYVSVEYINTVGALSVSVIDNHLTVNMTEFGDLASDIKTAIENNQYSNDLVSVYLSGPDNVQMEQSPVNLTGGSSGLLLAYGTISGVAEPVNGGDAVNKYFMDNYFTMTTSNIIDTGPVTYLAASMIQSTIYRDLTAPGVVIDTTDSATNLINANADQTIFKVKNVSTSVDSIIDLRPGTDVFFDPSVTLSSPLYIYPGYELDSIITTSSTGAMINIIGLNFVNTNNNFLMKSTNIRANVTNITSQFHFDTSSVDLTNQTVTYTPKMIRPVINRTYNGEKTDQFGPVSMFISGLFFNNSPIDYIFTTGAVELVIRNTSSTGTLNLVPSTGWEFDSLSIDYGKTGYFYLYVDTQLITGKLYTIGIFDTK